MRAVRVQQPAVGGVVVRVGQRGQGPPKAFGQRQILRGGVLEPGQLHRVLHDYESVSLDDVCEKNKNQYESLCPTRMLRTHQKRCE